MNNETDAIQLWHDAFVAIVEDGIDPGEAADAMLTTAGLLLAKHRGIEAARLALLAGMNFMARLETPPEPSGGLH